jgi:hypothetical protein
MAFDATAQQLTHGEAMKVIGGLSGASKMPWFGWSISAEICKVGAKLRKIKGSTCSTCYALKGNYVFKNVKDAHARRLAASQDPRFEDCFVQVLTRLHKNGRKERSPGVKENRFRWFDAGDIQGLAMLESICRIAERTPQIDHWLPTREYRTVALYLKKHGKFPDNLCVRLSAHMMGERPKKQPHGLAFSTVDVVDQPDIQQCVAPTQGNQCLSCDMCWQSDLNVNYMSH